MKLNTNFHPHTLPQYQRIRKGVFILPSLITITNIYAGFYSVIESLKGYKYMALENTELAANHFNIAAMCIGWSVLCDFLDGRIARLVNATSDFGVELDSLADVLSFGIAPAVLAYTWGYGLLPGFQKIGWATSFIYLICGALRLARFNVQAHQTSTSDSTGKPGKKFFMGLPIPAAAGLIASIAHFAPIPIPNKDTLVEIFSQSIHLSTQTYGLLLLGLVATLSLFMVSTIKFNNFKGVGPHTRHPQMMLPIIALLICAIYFYSEWTLLIIATIYASQGPTGKLLSLFSHKPALSSTETRTLEFDESH